MAVTGVITCSPSGVSPNQTFDVTLTLTNDSTVVYVSTVTPSLTEYGGTAQNVSASKGLAPFLPGANITIGASGTLTMKWKDVIYAPIGPYTNSMFGWYEVGALIRLTDGTRITATTALVGVYGDSNSAYSGLQDFTKFENSGYVAVI